MGNCYTMKFLPHYALLCPPGMRSDWRTLSQLLQLRSLLAVDKYRFSFCFHKIFVVFKYLSVNSTTDMVPLTQNIMDTAHTVPMKDIKILN